MVESSLWVAIKRCVEFISEINRAASVRDEIESNHVPVGAMRRDSFFAGQACAPFASFRPAVGPAALVADTAVRDCLNALEA
jgi:hypothetical protein